MPAAAAAGRLGPHASRSCFPPAELTPAPDADRRPSQVKGWGGVLAHLRSQKELDEAVCLCLTLSSLDFSNVVAMMHRCSALLPLEQSLAVPAQPCKFSASHRIYRGLDRLEASSARLEATTARERVRPAHLQHNPCAHMVCLSIAALQVLNLLDAGRDNYNQGNLQGDMEALLASESGSHQPGPDTIRLGQGCWQVKCQVQSAVGACRALQRLL